MCLQLFVDHIMLFAINCTTPTTNGTQNSTMPSILNITQSTMPSILNGTTINILNNTMMNTSNHSIIQDDIIIEEIITAMQSPSASTPSSTPSAPASYQDQPFNDPMVYVAIIAPIAALVLIWFIAAYLRVYCKPCKPNVEKKSKKPTEEKQPQCCCSNSKVKPVKRDTQHIINPV